MKRIFLTTILLFAAAAIAMAQSWQKFNYQAVARDATGEVIENQAIGVRISIHSGTMAGPTEYQETHSVTTNDFGLFDLAIGGGTVVSGNFIAIPWGGDNFYVQVEMDPAGGTTYADMGTSQLLSTPYAQYAKEAGDAPSSISGSANYLVKFTGSDVGGNSVIYENSGNLGIGTTSPDRDIHILNDANDAIGITLDNSSTGTFAAQRISFDNEQGSIAGIQIWGSGASASNQMAIFNNRTGGEIEFATAGLDRLNIKNNGYIGMGTSTPNRKVHVTGIGTTYLQMGNDATGTSGADGMSIGVESGGGAHLWQWEADYLKFGTGNAERMRITDVGDIGIRITSPVRNLHLLHDQFTGGGGEGGFALEQSSNNDRWTLYVSQTNSNLKLYFNDSERGAFDDVTGNYTAASDRRLKKNIERLEGSLNKIMLLNPSKYHFKTQTDSESKCYGLIAQEVEEVLPEIVTIHGDDTNGKGITDLRMVSYTELIPIMISGMQEQQALIEQLQAEIESLKNQ